MKPAKQVGQAVREVMEPELVRGGLVNQVRRGASFTCYSSMLFDLRITGILILSSANQLRKFDFIA